jgi:acetoacetate decarboxylase
MKIADVKANAFAMPLTSPVFPRGPYRFRNREYLVITYRTNPDALHEIVPGRELWGFPKKLASPQLEVEIDTLVGTLDYGKVRIAKATMGFKHREADHAARWSCIRMRSLPWNPPCTSLPT